MTTVESIPHLNPLAYPLSLEANHYSTERVGLRRTASVQSLLAEPISHSDLAIAELVASARPEPLRDFDQIPMRTSDLARQAKLVAPMFDGQKVAFVGDMDGAASLLGLLAIDGGPVPERILIVDFDIRVLSTAESLAQKYGFSDALTTRLYNVFDPIPADLLGVYDWFYINPPYGSHNQGASARLFLTRGCELVRTGGAGCVILPDDPARPWSRTAMVATQQCLLASGWMIREKVNHLHHYHLDDDPALTSSLTIVDRLGQETGGQMPYAGRSVSMNEIPNFYGRSVLPPYPRFINLDGRPMAANSRNLEVVSIH